MAYDLKCVFDRYKYQPIEIITKSGFKYCGTVAYVYEDSVDIIDHRERVVHIEYKAIEAVIEPQMKLKRLCGDNDCCCSRHDDDDDCCCRRHDDDDDDECCCNDED